MIDSVPAWAVLFGTPEARRLVARLAALNEPPLEVVEACRELAGEAAPRLAVAVLARAGRVLAHVGFEPETEIVDGGILVWDERFAGYLEGIGPRGRELAEGIRGRSASRMRDALAVPSDVVRRRHVGGPGAVSVTVPCGLEDPALWWLWRSENSKPPRWFLVLADVVWVEEVKEQAERAARLRYPAPPMPVARALRDLWRADVVDGGLVDERGARSPLVPRGPADLAALEGHPGLCRLDSPTADRLFVWLLRAAFELHTAAPFALNVYDVRVRGGWRELARQVEGRPVGAEVQTKVRNDIRSLIEALSHVSLGWDIPGVERGSPRPLVMVRDEIPAAPGRPGSFTLGLSPLWTPGLVHYLSAREDRPLVPWLPLPEIPVGERLHPAAVRLFRGVRVALREGTDERGYALLDWPALAQAADFPQERLPDVLDAWSGEDGPLERAGDRYAPRDPEAKAMLAEAGDRSQRGSSGGRRGARKRWRR